MLMGEFEMAGGSELELEAASLPAGMKVMVLDPAL
jgi:hypothetical protein